MVEQRIEIRRATHEDEDPLLPMYRAELMSEASAAAYGVRADVNWADLVRAVRLDPRQRLLVAVCGDEIVGFIHSRFVGRGREANRRLMGLGRFWVRRSGSLSGVLRSRKVGLIEHCFVSERWRRRGIAARLVRAAEQWLHSEDCCWIELNVRVDNGSALRFWHSHGYADSRLSLVKRWGT